MVAASVRKFISFVELGAISNINTLNNHVRNMFTMKAVPF
jgi:hypothetical protein